MNTIEILNKGFIYSSFTEYSNREGVALLQNLVEGGRTIQEDALEGIFFF